MLCFNPRAHAGRDIMVILCSFPTRRFNPRANAGRDGSIQHRSSKTGSFNPRAHAGRDHIVSHQSGEDEVSIHAPTQGATTVGNKATKPTRFQSTRPRRARLYKHHSTEYQYFTNIFPRTYPFAKISTASDSKNNQKLIDF